MKITFVKRVVLTAYVAVAFFAGCSGQNGITPQAHVSDQTDQKAQRAIVATTATPYRFQIVDVGHGANDVVYDSYLIANYTPGPTPSPTHTPYALGQPIYLIVRSASGLPPTNVTWQDGNGASPMGYVSYPYPSPSVIFTSGAITLTTPPATRTNPTPIPYQEYALPNSGNVTVTGQIPGTSATFNALVNIPVVAPTVAITAAAYNFRVLSDGNEQYLRSLGATTGGGVNGNTETYIVTSGSPSTGGRLSINQQISQYCVFFEAGNTLIYDRAEPTAQPLHTPYFDTSVPYQYAGVSISPNPYFTPDFAEPTIAPGIGSNPGPSVSMTQVDSPYVILQTEVALARAAYPTASPISEIGAFFKGSVYLMYRPTDLPSSPPSIWVPIASTQWNASGAAVPATPAPGATPGDASQWIDSTPAPVPVGIINPLLPSLSSFPIGMIYPFGDHFQSQSCI